MCRITDPNVQLSFSIRINLQEVGPRPIIISAAANEIKGRLEAEGYYLCVYPDPRRQRPEIILEPTFTILGRVPETVSGDIPDEIKDYKVELAALCILDEVVSEGHQAAKECLHIRIEVVSDNEIILRPYKDNP